MTDPGVRAAAVRLAVQRLKVDMEPWDIPLDYPAGTDKYAYGWAIGQELDRIAKILPTLLAQESTDV